VVQIQDLEWDERNQEHIARHGVTPAETFEVVGNRPFITRGRGNTFRVIGQTNGGRYLTLYLAPRSRGSFYVVTARDATGEERRAFRAK
jgi:uncharacterized DUF497 family protein